VWSQDNLAVRHAAATCAGSWVIGVRNAQHRQPKYAPVFLAGHPDGLYLRNAMSTSQRDWRRAVVPLGHSWTMTRRSTWRSSRRPISGSTRSRETSERLLGTSPSLRVNAKYAEVMGSTLGRARETHIRSALKRLQLAGVLSSNCVGAKKLQDHVVIKA
jgi:hypothetical protein